MANYSNLTAYVASQVYQNSHNLVTADMVKAALNQMVTELGAGYQYMGVADLNTPSSSPDYKCFYVVSEAGTYTNFVDSNNDPLVVNDGEVCIFKWDSAWSKEVTGAATAVDALAAKILSQKADIYNGAVSFVTRYDGWMDASGINVTYYSPKFILIPILPGQKIRIIGNSTYGSPYCFLKSFHPLSNGESFDICSGYSRVSVAAGADTGDVVAPSDAFCVFVGVSYNSTDRTPDAIYLDGRNVLDLIFPENLVCSSDIKIIAEYGATSGLGQILATFSGGYLTTPNYVRCDYLFNKSVAVSCGAYQFNLFAYDADKVFLSLSGWSASGASVAIPSNTKFIKINFKNDNLLALPLAQEITISGISRVKGSEVEVFNDNKPNLLGTQAINAPVGLHISNPLANEGTAQTIQDDDDTIYVNHGVLLLPTNYDENGNPTPLIVFCHGWSEHYGATSYQIATSSSADIAYLLKEGFAVFDMDGNVKSTTIGHGCSDMAVECYMAGIAWVQKRFNVTKDIYLAGHSQGGMMALLLSRLGSLPVRACCVVSPANSLLNLIQLFSGSTASDVKDAMVSYYGLTGTTPTWTTTRGAMSAEEKAFFFDNFSKIAKSSFLWGDVCDLSAEDIEALQNYFTIDPESAETYYYQDKHKIIKVPTKVINGGADTSCNTEWNRLISKMAQNSGGRLDFRVISGADHGSVMTLGGNTIETIFGESVNNVPTALAEMVKFLRRY